MKTCSLCLSFWETGYNALNSAALNWLRRIYCAGITLFDPPFFYPGYVFTPLRRFGDELTAADFRVLYCTVNRNLLLMAKGIETGIEIERDREWPRQWDQNRHRGYDRDRDQN
ncbi:hypothetical protein EVAR_9650_1 [Eumeta japonica]|uniref:Uncharacterized protein n=1 Tax=Eumeta variegata TaxID=151549 RepID=A0A4C1TJM4_EUMVA|nr:hypothetical protein EVAR_9650_1 [Eumeta japonica]